MITTTPPYYSVLQLPAQERPRERLLHYGPEAISTTELIAIILGSGTKEAPVLQLAHQIIAFFGSLQKLAEASVEELCQIKGVGMAKAIQLKAAFSLGLRVQRQNETIKYRIDNPLHVYNLIKDELEREKRELFIVILLNTKGVLISHHIVSIGTLSTTLVHPREVFYPAIRHKAAGIILAHNHPSGDPTPSTEDYETTQLLVEAGHLLSIPVYDHLVIGHASYISLRQEIVRHNDPKIKKLFDAA